MTLDEIILLAVPAETSVLAVSGTNVKDWRVKDGQLQVVLHRETLGTHGIYVSYERAAKGKAEVPVIRTVGVEREQGFIAVIALANPRPSTES